MKKLVPLIILLGLVLTSVEYRPVAAALTISPNTLPMAFVGKYYLEKLDTNSKYPHNVHWSIVSGSLPPGLNFKASIPVGSPAYVEGWPTSEGDYTFTVGSNEQVPDGNYAEQKYTLQVRTKTLPSQTPMEFDCIVTPTKIVLDPSEIALGRIGSVYADFTLNVWKTGGDLTEYVNITMSFDRVEPASAFRVIPYETGGQPPMTKTIQVFVDVDGWRTVEGMTHTLFITCETPEETQTLTVQIEVLSVVLSDLQLVSVQPITQHGQDLVKNKEAQFAFTYTRKYQQDPVKVTEAKVEVKLPKSQWDFTPQVAYGFDFRDEGGFYIVKRQFTFSETSVPWELMFFPPDEGFFYPKPITSVASLTMTIDPDNEIAEQNENNNQISASWSVPYEASKLNLAWVWYRPLGMSWTGNPSPFPTVAKRYLPAIFPIKTLNVQPLLGDGINAWTALASWPMGSNSSLLAYQADNIAEMAEESGYQRVIAILPEGALGTLLGGGVNGVVCPGNWWFANDAYRVAYVNLNDATDASNGHRYIPVVAHELSHTFGFPDIYDHCTITPRVGYRWIYFDQVYGGIMNVGDPKNSAANMDIMACGGYGSGFWSDASYQAVHDGLKAFGDPPEGLLISMMIFKNGTVDARPFQKLVDHPFPFPNAEGTGDFYLDLVDKYGNVLRRYPWNVRFSIFIDPGGEQPVDAVPLVSVVEYFDNLGAVELRDANGTLWMRNEVSAHKPELAVVEPAPGERLNRGCTSTFEWNGADADGDEIWYSVLMRKSDQETWSNLSHYVKEKTLNFTVPIDAELGDYYIKFIATDGINTDMKIVGVSISPSGALSQIIDFLRENLLFIAVGIIVVIAIAVAVRRRHK
jgi:hypothetical protein